MTTINVSLPESLHETVRKLVEKEGISINQFIMLALAEKVSALATEDYLLERANRSDKAKFLAAMSKVADVEPPDERDRL
ncbi:MAG: ribbon-helix-helix protein, CopG family [Acidobacteria bacterium]|nr:ribbon-helix-helix protein, CopG family [Acidobacteriota bacterium]